MDALLPTVLHVTFRIKWTSDSLIVCLRLICLGVEIVAVAYCDSLTFV